MSGERRILLGKIAGAFGVRGWLKLHSYTEPREALLGYLPWILCTREIESEILEVEGRAQGRGLIVHLPGIDTREQAEALFGSEIWVARGALPQAQPGQHYWVDLEGLAVFTITGQALGRVSHLFATGANDVLVVSDASRERLIPFLPGTVVRNVDFDSGRIEVDWDPEF